MSQTHAATPAASTGHRARKSVAILVSVFALFLAILSGLAILGLGLHSSVRAYVGGEGLWSKAEKDAVFELDRYIATGDEASYRRFESFLAVPLGDRRAREELQKPSPDVAIAAAGFIQGRNHPGDVNGMIRLFRNFGWIPEMARAIAIWTEGDAMIVEIRQLAARIHAASSTGTLPPGQRDAFAAELRELNARLTILEDDFSATLGIAARWVRALLIDAILGIGLLLVAVGAFVARRIARLLDEGERALSASERRYRELFERSPAGLYRANVDGHLLACNSALANLLGYESKDDVLTLTVGELFADPPARKDLIADLRSRRIPINHEVCLKRRDGQSRWALLNESVLPAADGEPVMEGSLIDITDRKQTEEINHHRATHDSLTNLPNRALFSDRLTVAMRQARRRDQVVGVLFLDLDAFKAVNDEHGHAVGDEILVEAGRRLTSCLRAGDTVARLGGDEFILLLAGITEDDIPDMARRILDAFRSPFELKDGELAVSASLGISVYPDDGADVETLVAKADAALYRAKDAGRDAFAFFAPATIPARARRAFLRG